jgi:hypothetical protein
VSDGLKKIVRWASFGALFGMMCFLARSMLFTPPGSVVALPHVRNLWETPQLLNAYLVAFTIVGAAADSGHDRAGSRPHCRR